MDLSNISYRQAVADINVANERVIEISLKIQTVAVDLGMLRRELEDLSGQVHVQLESISDQSYSDTSSIPSLRLEQGLRFIGWVVPLKEAQGFAKAVIVLSREATLIKAGCDMINRYDVAQHFANTDLVRAGFEILFSAQQLLPGIFEAALEVYTDTGRRLSKSLGRFEIVA